MGELDPMHLLPDHQPQRHQGYDLCCPSTTYFSQSHLLPVLVDDWKQFVNQLLSFLERRLDRYISLFFWEQAMFPVLPCIF